ncbi:hypothetical protein YC2023_090031 [Brassica napus]
MAFGFQPCAHIRNCLIDAYYKPSELRYADQLLDEIPEPDKVAKPPWSPATGHRETSPFLWGGGGGVGGWVFEETPASMRDSVMFTAMISGYINRVTYQEVLEMVRRMVSSGVEFDEFTYPSIITL